MSIFTKPPEVILTIGNSVKYQSSFCNILGLLPGHSLQGWWALKIKHAGKVQLFYTDLQRKSFF